MGRTIAPLLSAFLIASATSARADGPPAATPLDVSGWFLRGNIDDDAPQESEGRSYFVPTVLGDLANSAARPTRFSMIEKH